MDLKEIPKDQKTIIANGVKYTLTDKLSINRFIAFQKFEIEVAYPIGFLGVMKGLDNGINYLNKQKWVDAAVEISNVRDSIIALDKNKRLPAVDICSLFLNSEDEDVTVITDDMLKTKQENFEKEGIEVAFFLHLASELVRGFKQTLKPKE